jgi:hypothetical protein
MLSAQADDLPASQPKELENSHANQRNNIEKW